MFCPNCNGDSGPHACCHDCHTYLPRTAFGVRAGLAPRAFAFLLDALILFLFLVAAAWAMRFGKQDGPIPTHMVAVVAAASLLYIFAFLRGLSSGQTLGKLVFGLATVDVWQAHAPGLKRMLLRETLGKLVGAAALGLGYLSALRDGDRRAWHDKMAGTVVLARSQSSLVAPAAPAEQPLWPVPYLAAFMLLLVSALLAPTLQQPVKGAHASQPTPDSQHGAPLAVSYTLRPRFEAPAAKPSAMVLAEPTSPATPSRPAPIATQPRPFAPRPLAIQPARPIQPPSSPLTAPAPVIRTVIARAPTPSPPEPPTPQDDPAGEIQHFLTNWSSAEADDAAEQVGHFYAPDVQRYFLRRNVPRSYVVADHQAYLDRGLRAHFFAITDVRFDRLSTNSAALDVVKSWNQMSRDQTASVRKSTRSRLWLQKFPDGWKIVGEQDLQTP